MATSVIMSSPEDTPRFRCSPRANARSLFCEWCAESPCECCFDTIVMNTTANTDGNPSRPKEFPEDCCYECCFPQEILDRQLREQTITTQETEKANGAGLRRRVISQSCTGLIGRARVRFDVYHVFWQHMSSGTWTHLFLPRTPCLTTSFLAVKKESNQHQIRSIQTRRPEEQNSRRSNVQLIKRSTDKMILRLTVRKSPSASGRKCVLTHLFVSRICRTLQSQRSQLGCVGPKRLGYAFCRSLLYQHWWQDFLGLLRVPGELVVRTRRRL